MGGYPPQQMRMGGGPRWTEAMGGDPLGGGGEGLQAVDPSGMDAAMAQRRRRKALIAHVFTCLQPTCNYN
eukprot:6051530-Prymnesium_polylepis.1